MRLNRTPSLNDRKWRNEENENWSMIGDSLDKVDSVENFLKGFDGRQMIQQSYNLFNKETVTEGGLSRTTGAVISGGYYVSDYIPVVPGKRLQVKPAQGVTTMYDLDLNFIGAVPAGEWPYLLPSGVRYIRTQLSKASLDGKYVYLGDQDLPFVEYGWDYMPEFYDMIRSLTEESDKEYINLFNPSTVVEGGLDSKTGEVTSGTYYVTDFIEVISGKEIQLRPAAGWLTIYDKDRKFIKSIPSSEVPKVIPSNGKYIRNQLSKTSLEGKYIYMGTDDMPYYPYGEGPGKSSGGGSDSKPLKVLSIGNSYSNDTFWMLKDIAQSAGKELTVGVAHLSGGTLQQMWDAINNDKTITAYNKWTPSSGHKQNNNASPRVIIVDEPWDFIFFQQASTQSMNYDTFQPYLKNIANYVQNNATNSKVRYGINMIWPRPVSNSSIGTPEKQLEVYNDIVDAYQKAAFDTDLEVFVPTGTAIMNGRNNDYLADISNELTRDGSHLDEGIGRYLAAMTVFITLYSDHGIGSVSYKPSGVNDYHLYLAKVAAQKAVIEPFKVTKV